MKIYFLIMFVLISFKSSSPIEKPNIELKEQKYSINNTPVDVVKTYWKTELNKSEVFEEIITKTPNSYWHQCDDTNTYNPEQQDVSPYNVWEDNYLSLTVSTRKYIDVNRMNIVAVEEERKMNDEATVIVDSKNNFTKQKMRFYLTRDMGEWKIFLVDSDISENPNLFYFAEPRPKCN